MKLLYKVMLNRLYKKCNGDIQTLTQVITGMQSPSDDLKLEFIEYIKKYKERKYKKCKQC